VRATPDNSEALAFALRSARAAVLDRKRTLPTTGSARESTARSSKSGSEEFVEDEPPAFSTRPPSTGPLDDQAEVLLRELDFLAHSPEDSRRSHAIVRSIFELCGASQITESTFDNSPDFAIWHDGIQNIVGNPLLVEVKYRLSTTTAFNDAVLELSRYLSKSNARSALLLYSNSNYGIYSAPFPIMVCELRDFIRRLQYRSFVRVIRDLQRVVRGKEI